MNTNPNAKRILCYGDSNTRGQIPGTKDRFDQNTRWTKLLAAKLGAEYEVIEEGLGGRTIAYDDPRTDFQHRNGSEYFHVFLESHKPLDLVIIMLGTTDVKPMFNPEVEIITQNLAKLINITKIYEPAAKILLICPAIVDDQTDFSRELFKGGTKLGGELRKSFKELAQKEQLDFIDANKHGVEVDKADGVHLNAENHQKLAEIIYNYIINNL